eukprot:5838320-Amphidinium_carterae.1
MFVLYVWELPGKGRISTTLLICTASECCGSLLARLHTTVPASGPEHRYRQPMAWPENLHVPMDPAVPMAWTWECVKERSGRPRFRRWSEWPYSRHVV